MNNGSGSVAALECCGEKRLGFKMKEFITAIPCLPSSPIKGSWMSGYQPLGKDVLDAAKTSLARFNYLGRRCVGVFKSIPSDTLLPNQDLFEEWLPTLYRLCWNYPNQFIQAGRCRIFKALGSPPFNLDTQDQVCIPLERPDASKDLLSVNRIHDGKTWVQKFSVLLPHAYFASLTPDIFTASAYALSLLCQEAITPQIKHDKEASPQPRPNAKESKGKHKTWRPKDVAIAEKILRAINRKRKDGSFVKQAAKELAEEDKSLGMTHGAIERMYYRLRRNKKAPSKNKLN
jgi:hypothetical protein